MSWEAETLRSRIQVLDLGKPASVAALRTSMEALPPQPGPAAIASLARLAAVVQGRQHDGVLELGELAERMLARALPRLPVHQWLALDQRLRASDRGHMPVWESFWVDLQPEHVGSAHVWPRSHAFLSVLASHPRGRVRERAVRRLATSPRKAVPALLVRTCDWVAPVRGAAREGLQRLVEEGRAERLSAALELMRRIQKRSRVDHALFSRMEVLLLREPERTLARVLEEPHPTASQAYGALLTRENMWTPGLIRAALERGSPSLRSMAAGHVTSGTEPEQRALRRRLLVDRASRVRLLGIELMGLARDADGPVALSACIDDTSAAVRHAARYWLRELGAPTDWSEHYRQRVEAADAPPGAVFGLAETGVAQDWERMIPLLDERPKLARAALRGMRTLANVESRETRWMMVGDLRPGVSREATKQLRHDLWPQDASFLRDYLASATPHICASAFALAAQLMWVRGVDRLEVLQLVLSVSDEEFLDVLNTTLSAWFHRFGAWCDLDEFRGLRRALDAHAGVAPDIKRAFAARERILERWSS